jgi:hypothetical protein
MRKSKIYDMIKCNIQSHGWNDHHPYFKPVYMVWDSKFGCHVETSKEKFDECDSTEYKYIKRRRVEGLTLSGVIDLILDELGLEVKERNLIPAELVKKDKS